MNRMSVWEATLNPHSTALLEAYFLQRWFVLSGAQIEVSTSQSKWRKPSSNWHLNWDAADIKRFRGASLPTSFCFSSKENSVLYTCMYEEIRYCSGKRQPEVSVEISGGNLTVYAIFFPFTLSSFCSCCQNRELIDWVEWKNLKHFI